MYSSASRVRGVWRGSWRMNRSRFIVRPFNPRYRAWKMFLVLLVLYTALVGPFEFGFLNGRPRRPISIIDNVVNAFFLLDIILTFFVAYLDKNSYLLVDNPKKIAKRYALSYRMAFDIISIIPYEIVEKILPASASRRIYGLPSMLRLWRLSYVVSIFRRLENNWKVNYFCMRCLKLILVTFFVAHLSGCFYFRIAAAHHDPKNTWIWVLIGDFHHLNLWNQYVVSAYWGISTVTTLGYGDPVNQSEMLYSIFCLFLNTGLMAYVIGNMTNLLAKSGIRSQLYRDRIEAIMKFSRRNGLPLRLQEQMLANALLKYRIDSEGLIQQQEILDSLPKAIRSSISHYQFYSLVHRVYLFCGVSNDLLCQLVPEIKPEFCSSKEDVILQNESPTDFYVIVSGTVELIQIINGVEQVVGEAKSGDLVGEISVLCYRPQIFTVRTFGLCQLLRINRETFLNIVQASVGDRTIIMNNLIQHLKEQDNNPIMKRISEETVNMLEQGRSELVNLHFAAVRGDDSLIHQLLKRGLDPNESEESGRTALHAAASNGSEKCVDLLLQYKADPNCRDREGNTPLWGAILGGHESVIKLLREYGADINAGDFNRFVQIATEQRNLDLLKWIVRVGGNINQSSANARGIALYMAVCEGDFDLVKNLVDQGCDIDRPIASGVTLRQLADTHGNEEIKALFESLAAGCKPLPIVMTAEDRSTVQFVEEEDVSREMERKDARTSKKTENFRNSFSRVVSAARDRQDDDPFRGLLGPGRTSTANNMVGASFYTADAPSYPTRVSISCPQKDRGGTLIIVPDTFDGLLEMVSQKFGVVSGDIEVEIEDGSKVDCLDVIRDGDRLNVVPKRRK